MNRVQATAFVERLERLADESRRADRAMIKRARTGHPAQRIQARRVYHQLVPDGMPHSSWVIRLVERTCGLFVLNPSHQEGGPSVGAAARRLASLRDVSEEAVERRLMSILGAGPETLDQHLARLNARLHAHGIGLDYVRLTRDLNQASHPDRYIQQRWADEFWAREGTDDTTQTPDGRAPEATLDSSPTTESAQ